ncbi:hypothetical protein [Roseicella aerolata]|uniref:Uncharacterized protein n=1 Tax=Roseicella aerolata TaxID=2883479 RepID=A0A9X1LDQ9_9PROT|nr:hypothetical protein [Roseicella aerolata]MCB4825157.1 hypothetical protein [Roseicella aerolata]
MTLRITGAMVSVLIAVAAVAAVAFVVDALELERDPAGIALIVLAGLGGIAFLARRLWRRRRRPPAAGGLTPGAGPGCSVRQGVGASPARHRGQATAGRSRSRS